MNRSKKTKPTVLRVLSGLSVVVIPLPPECKAAVIADADHLSAARGIEKEKRLPCPTVLRTSMRPPCRSTIPRAM